MYFSCRKRFPTIFHPPCNDTLASMNDDNRPTVPHDASSKDEHGLALEALELRFRFENHSFGKLWPFMQKAGWTHKDRTYISPDGSRVFSSNEVIEYLDQVAIPHAYSSLQRQSMTMLPIDEETIRMKCRRDILRYMYMDTTKHIEDSEDSLRDDDDDEKGETNAAVCLPHRLRSRETQRHKTLSSTAGDKGTDLYFRKNAKSRKKPTSQKTADFENLTYPTHKECADIVNQLPIGKVDAVEAKYKQNFREWRFLLSTNHSLLFFGAGSKYNLLLSFANEELDKEGYVLVLDGFDKEISAKGILDLLVMVFLGNKEPEMTAAMSPADNEFPVAGIFNPYVAPPLVDRAIAISRAIARNAESSLLPVFVVVHNLEGAGLRSTLAQEVLAALVTNSVVSNGVRSIRLVASVDHVDAPLLLWKVQTASNFSWIQKEVHTHRLHSVELELLASDDARKKTSKVGFSGFENWDRALEVLKNLAPRLAEVVQILARMQLEKESEWIKYVDFLAKCKSSCAVTKDSQLRTFLAELRDHRLITSKVEESIEYVRVPYPDNKLNEILASRNGAPR